MVLVDTHVFIWWIQGDTKLSEKHKKFLKVNEDTGIYVSIISCWEITKLIEKNRLSLPLPVNEWFQNCIFL